MLFKFPLFFIILLLSFTCLFDATASAQQVQSQAKNKHNLPAFTAQYTVLHKSDPVGTAVRQLSYQTDGSINYHYETKVKWLIFSQTRRETSILTIKDSQVIPQHFTYTREGTGKDKSYEWRFNAKENSGQDIGRKRKAVALDFSQNLQDTLSYHLQHRLNLINDATKKTYSYPVIKTSGSLANYDYQYSGEEELILPFGLVKTICFKREVKEKKRVTYAWFAPELDYLLVKIYQVKAGNEQFEAQLSSLTIDDKTGNEISVSQ